MPGGATGLQTNCRAVQWEPGVSTTTSVARRSRPSARPLGRKAHVTHTATLRLSFRATRTVKLVVAAGIGLGLLVAAPVLVSSAGAAYAAGTRAGGAAQAGQSGDPAATARWLQGELFSSSSVGSGPVGSIGSGRADWGLTIDTYWAMKAGGLSASDLAPTWKAIEANAASYAGPFPGAPGQYSAGASAKVLLAAETAGADPTKVRTKGGKAYDFRQRTLDLIGTSGADKGRLMDAPKRGADDTNTVGQSLAVMGLVGAGTLDATDRATVQSAVDFLRTQQCAAGYFRLSYPDGLSCQAAIPSGAAAPDNDGTAMAAQALMAASRAGFVVPPLSIKAALDHFVSAQESDGSFGGGVNTQGANANSTGLVAATLEAGGRTTEAAKAGTWVAALEATTANAAGTPLATDLGAVAYNPAAFADGLAKGIGKDPKIRDPWRRASAQAIFGLRRLPFADLIGTVPPPAPPTTTSSTTTSSTTTSSTTDPSTTTSPTTDPSTTTTTSPTTDPSTTTTTSPTTTSPTTTPPTAAAPPPGSTDSSTASIASRASADVGASSPTSPAVDTSAAAVVDSSPLLVPPFAGAAPSVSTTTVRVTVSPTEISSPTVEVTTDDSLSQAGPATSALPEAVAAGATQTANTGLPAYVWAIFGGITLAVVFLAVSALRPQRR